MIGYCGKFEKPSINVSVNLQLSCKLAQELAHHEGILPFAADFSNVLPLFCVFMKRVPCSREVPFLPMTNGLLRNPSF